MTAILTHANIIPQPKIRAIYAGIQVNILDILTMQHGERFAILEACQGTPFADGAKSTTRTKRLTVDARLLSNTAIVFSAHGEQWSVCKTDKVYELFHYEMIGVFPIPHYVCATQIDGDLGLALRHLAEKAEKTAKKPGWFEFLYAWMEKE